MKRQNTFTAILLLFIIALCANVSDAQFGDIMNKTKEKVNKKTNGTNNTQTNDEGLRWDLALKNTNFTGSVNEAAMKQMINNGMNDNYGKGGLLVFTKQPFAKKSATITDTILQMKAGDSIYLTAFLAEQFGSDNMDKNLSLEVKIVPIGDTKYAQTGYLANSMEINYGFYNGATTNVLPLDFLPAGGKSANYQAQVGDIARTLRKLPKGVHIVQLRLVSNMQGASAVGAFYYDNSAGNDDTAINATRAAVKMPAAAKRDAALEKMIMDLGNAGAGTGANDARMLRVVITDRDWTPLRNEVTGVLVGRAISTVVAIKGSDGVCFQQPNTYTQNYDGRTYTGLRLDSVGRETEMACENVMK